MPVALVLRGEEHQTATGWGGVVHLIDELSVRLIEYVDHLRRCGSDEGAVDRRIDVGYVGGADGFEFGWPAEHLTEPWQCRGGLRALHQRGSTVFGRAARCEATSAEGGELREDPSSGSNRHRLKGNRLAIGWVLARKVRLVVDGFQGAVGRLRVQGQNQDDDNRRTDGGDCEGRTKGIEAFSEATDDL